MFAADRRIILIELLRNLKRQTPHDADYAQNTQISNTEKDSFLSVCENICKQIFKAALNFRFLHTKRLCLYWNNKSIF